ncbi:MAG: MauE/DoxX family redox-associated membrane protein [Opitutaceae bacterium]
MTNSARLPWSDATWAFLSLRLFLAFRWIISAIEKFELNHEYSFASYSTNMKRMAGGISGSSFIPQFLATPFAYSLGYITLIAGVLLLLGVKTRCMLLLTAVLYTSLSAGLMAVDENEGVAWLAIHVALTAGALVLIRHNRLAITAD